MNINEPILGLCRFSFCGNGDWVAFRSAKTPEQVSAVQAKIAKSLYAKERMEKRFFLFENFLLKSLSAQIDQNYILIVLTSQLMPEMYKERLIQLCQDNRNVELIFSDASSVHDAIWPTISSYNTTFGHPLVNFRIDDDDCLSVDYIRELRKFMLRLGDIIPVSYSRSNGLVAIRYGSEAARFFRATVPFNSMGTAIRVHGERTVFSFGHSALHRRFPAVVDNFGMGFISIKVDGHDSLEIDENSLAFKNSHRPIEDQQLEEALSKWFSFVRQGDQSLVSSLNTLIENIP